MICSHLFCFVLFSSPYISRSAIIEENVIDRKLACYRGERGGEEGYSSRDLEKERGKENEQAIKGSIPIGRWVGPWLRRLINVRLVDACLLYSTVLQQ